MKFYSEHNFFTCFNAFLGVQETGKFTRFWLTSGSNGSRLTVSLAKQSHSHVIFVLFCFLFLSFSQVQVLDYV